MQAVGKSVSCLARLTLLSSRCRLCDSSRPLVCTRWNAPRYSTSAEPALASPHVEGSEKTFDPKIHAIVSDIGSLTLLEVADLNQLLKKTLNIADAPVMMAGAMPAAIKQEEEEEVAAPEKSLFSVLLKAFSVDKKVPLIKEVKALIPGTNLVQAKKFVESLPQKVQGEVTKEEAETMKKKLEAAGGTVDIE